MKKMPCLANAAIILLLCLGIVGCASTQEEDDVAEIAEVEEEAVAVDEAAVADEQTGRASRPGRRPSSSESRTTPSASDAPEAAASTVIVPEGITLSELKDEADRMRSEAIATRKDVTMPDEWRAAEEAYNRGTEAYAESQRGFTQAIEGYLNMGITSDVVSLSDAATQSVPAAEAGALPAFYRVGTWASSRDCFWNISGNPVVYGDPFKWTVLYEANKDVLPDPNNPDLILPDTIITIPSINGEYREGTYNPATGTIEIGALDLDYFNIAYVSINR